MRSQGLARIREDADPIDSAVSATLDEIRALLDDLRDRKVQAARKAVAGAHIRATLARRARESEPAGG